MTLRSSGARLSRLASAEGHWSPRCMTARSSSLCLAGFPSRVAPSSRPTGQTPTLSRRAPAFYAASCPRAKAGKAAVVSAQQLRTIKADSSGFREVRSLFSRNGQAANSTDYCRRPGKYFLSSGLAYEAEGHVTIPCRWWGRHLARLCDKRSD